MKRGRICCLQCPQVSSPSSASIVSISVQDSGILIPVLHFQFHARFRLAKWEVINEIDIYHIGIVDDSFGFRPSQKRCSRYGWDLFPRVIERVSYTTGEGQVFNGFIRELYRCHTGYISRRLSDKGFLLSLIEHLQSPLTIGKIYRGYDGIARMVPFRGAPFIYLMEHFGVESQPEHIVGEWIPL